MTKAGKTHDNRENSIATCDVDKHHGAERLHEILEQRHQLLHGMRNFFYEKGYIEVETASLMRFPPPDPHIDPLSAHIGAEGPYYLHTSPEIGMKKLLMAGHKRLFQICKVFRVEEFDELHSTEFTMLEWYREGAYTEIMQEVEELVCQVAQEHIFSDKRLREGHFPVYVLKDLFLKKTGIDPFCMSRDELFSNMQERGFSGMNEGDDLSSLFFKLFLQEIEPALPGTGPYFIVDWPSFISTMAKEKEGHPGQVERFELYINGLEIANGYTELLDPVIQRQRFIVDNEERNRMGKQTFVIDDEFIGALSMAKGPVTGVSVGVDRLLMVLTGKTKIKDVLPGRFTTGLACNT